MRKRLFNRIKAGGKGGRPGQWECEKSANVGGRLQKAGRGYRD